MESPPSFSGWSEAPISLSEDSGLPLTNDSISSGERVICELPDSDGEDKSLSQYDSLDYSDSAGMCGEHFNTLKKGPNIVNLPIDPPPEFQDSPPSTATRTGEFVVKSEDDVSKQSAGGLHCVAHKIQNTLFRNRDICISRALRPHIWPLEAVAFSPIHSLSRNHNNRPASGSSLAGPSRLYSSHNSLSIVQYGNSDDSNFITQAMSHDALNGDISDIYNVPFDSDIYAIPVDTIGPLSNQNNKTTNVKTPIRPRRQIRQHRKRRRNTSASSQCEIERSRNLSLERMSNIDNGASIQKHQHRQRHSVAGSSGTASAIHISQEPLHMTLEEVHKYLQTLYSSSSDTSEKHNKKSGVAKRIDDHIEDNNQYKPDTRKNTASTNKKSKKTFTINVRNKKIKDSSNTHITKDTVQSKNNSMKNVDISQTKYKKSTLTFSLNIRQTLCNIFRFGKVHSPDRTVSKNQRPQISDPDKENLPKSGLHKNKNNLCKRALPPLPSGKLQVESEVHEGSEDNSMDFTLSIEKVKDYGWYWGPISGEAAERILSNEPDGSFIVRDSSDHHYIFSLTFKLNGCVRHVRIEHDQGNFSFGSCTKFKSHTIVEFIENAVEHSRSGRYLFFLHRRPVLGPMRVQLLHPVSRFKQVQSLQHMCRFIILKVVRRDLIPSLPLPRRVIDYLSTKHYYSELLADGESERNENDPEQLEEILNIEPLIEPIAATAPQSAIVHVITDNISQDEIDRLDRYRFHVIEQGNELGPALSLDTDNTSDGGKEVASSNSSSLNEIEGIRRGGRFRLGLRSNREKHCGNRQHCEESNS